MKTNKRMTSIFIISAFTALLAILSGYLQYRESLSQKEADLKNERELKDAYKQLSEKSDIIVSKSDSLKELQDEHQGELRRETNRIIELNVQLRKAAEENAQLQKEKLEYLTGGVDKLTGVNSIPVIKSMVHPDDIRGQRQQGYVINFRMILAGENAIKDIEVEFKPNRFDGTYDHEDRNLEKIPVPVLTKMREVFVFKQTFDHGNSLSRRLGAQITSGRGELRNELIPPYQLRVSWNSFSYNFEAHYRYDEHGRIVLEKETYNGHTSIEELAAELFKRK